MFVFYMCSLFTLSTFGVKEWSCILGGMERGFDNSCESCKDDALVVEVASQLFREFPLQEIS